MKGIFATAGLLSCLFFLPAPVFSQDFTYHPQNSLSLSVHFSSIVEENVSPLTFTGPGLGAALQRRYETENTYQYLELSGYAVLPKTASEKTTRSRLVSLAFKYAYMIRGAFGNDHLSVGAFGKVSFKDSYYKNYDETLLYWANFYGAGVAIALEQPINDSYAFEAVAELPLAGVAFRPELQRDYKIQNTAIGGVIKSNNSNGNFASPGNFLNPSLSLAILTSKRSLLRAVSYKYTRTQEKVAVSDQYRESNHSLTLTFMIIK